MCGRQKYKNYKVGMKEEKIVNLHFASKEKKGEIVLVCSRFRDFTEIVKLGGARRP